MFLRWMVHFAHNHVHAGTGAVAEGHGAKRRKIGEHAASQIVGGNFEQV